MDTPTPDNYSRIEKLFVDRDAMSPDAARKFLSEFHLRLLCGPEVAASPTLQTAILTAVNTAKRCFGGKLVLDMSAKAADPMLCVPWPRRTRLLEAIADICPNATHADALEPTIGGQLVFGSREDACEGLQVTFDGWTTAVSPVRERWRLPEWEKCAVAGVAAGALGISELFHSFAQITIEAGRRTVGFSLWRPDLPWTHSDASGIEIQFLPSEAWLLGLGHLGQAYLWALSFLPFQDHREANLLLNDFDRVVPANVGTGLLTDDSDVGRLKTRVAADWLENRGFQTRLLERRFDEQISVQADEPALSLCGFDHQGPRAALDDAGFQMVVECGLGNRPDNFDSVSLHSLPSVSRRSSERWSQPAADEQEARRVEKLASENPVYRQIGDERRCGEIELAGKAIAVPFVGAIAGAFAIAEVVRAVNDGERYDAIDLRLDCPDAIAARRANGCHRSRLRFQPAA